MGGITNSLGLYFERLVYRTHSYLQELRLHTLFMHRLAFLTSYFNQLLSIVEQ